VIRGGEAREHGSGQARPSLVRNAGFGAEFFSGQSLQPRLRQQLEPSRCAVMRATSSNRHPGCPETAISAMSQDGRPHRSSAAFRVHRHVSLHVSAIDHGAGAADPGAQDHGACAPATSTTTSAARFWAKIFAINFAMGVVTGIPMEFQFGTNWARFSQAAGGVIGQTLAMEGVFSFFLESSFLGLFLFGEKRWDRRRTGSPLPGVRRLVAFRLLHHRHRRLDAASHRLRAGPNGEILLSSFWGCC
jgi:hypothetical protein